MPRTLILACLLLAGCDGDSPPSSPRAPTAAWEIGPVIEGVNYSKGLPRHVAGSFAISPTAEPHYVTRPISGLVGKSSIRLRFKIDGAPGAFIYGAPRSDGRECGGASAVALYFQRAGDDWSGRPGWRWWHPVTARIREAGEGELTASLTDDRWASMGETGNAALFAKAKAEAVRVGFTFANCEGRGHGARASEPMRFTVLEFAIE